MLELEDLGAESPGLLLRGIQQSLGLLELLIPVSKDPVRLLLLWFSAVATEWDFPGSDRTSPSSSCSLCLALSREAFLALATSMASAASCNLIASFFLKRGDLRGLWGNNTHRAHQVRPGLKIVVDTKQGGL
jgi:hypothetical protein